MKYKTYNVNSNQYEDYDNLDDALVARETIVNQYLQAMQYRFNILQETSEIIDGIEHTTNTVVDLSNYPVTYKK